MEHRNRASGWKYAKLSGHKNEDLVKALLEEDASYAHAFLCRLGLGEETMLGVFAGGLHEASVPSVIATRKTKSKTDLKLRLKNRSPICISIKKSLSGQVYFVRAGLFMEIFETQFRKPIPPDVQRAINLFWAAAEDACDIIEQYSDQENEKAYTLQLRHKSLNATTLLAYNANLYTALLGWFMENAYDIAALCFSRGAVKDASEWADFIWYKNMLAENDVDDVIAIEDICTAAQLAAQTDIYFSTTNGGTTIQLPFGFVQWHQGQLQFHHNYTKIRELLKLL